MRFGSVIPLLLLVLLLGAATEQCTSQADGATCAGGQCTPAYHTGTCQSQYAQNGGHGSNGDPDNPYDPNPVNLNDISPLISRELFETMLLNRNDSRCPAKGFYTYDAFIKAASFFRGFGTTGDRDTGKREIAAFLAQTSHETTGGWGSAPDGPYTWGYCFVEEKKPHGNYCVDSQRWPCVFGKKYYGRGPMQISYNDKYGPAGEALTEDLLHNPDAVATNAFLSFKTALWFWMMKQRADNSNLSCHNVITGQWIPSQEDIHGRRFPGYGVITNIISGALECGHGPDPQMEDRMGFYRRYCDLLEVKYGDNQDCYDQKPFA